jgi:hypothetical protein
MVGAEGMVKVAECLCLANKLEALVQTPVWQKKKKKKKMAVKTLT